MSSHAEGGGDVELDAWGPCSLFLHPPAEVLLLRQQPHTRLWSIISGWTHAGLTAGASLRMISRSNMGERNMLDSTLLCSKTVEAIRTLGKSGFSTLHPRELRSQVFGSHRARTHQRVHLPPLCHSGGVHRLLTVWGDPLGQQYQGTQGLLAGLRDFGSISGTVPNRGHTGISGFS